MICSGNPEQGAANGQQEHECVKPKKNTLNVFHLCCINFQRAQEEIHQKEIKVNLLEDKVNNFIEKAPPTAHEALKAELNVLTSNYQQLCSRLDGKYKTLEVI